MSKNNFLYRVMATACNIELGERYDIVGHYLSNGTAKHDAKKMLPKLDEYDEVVIEKIILGKFRAPRIVHRYIRQNYNDWKEQSK